VELVAGPAIGHFEIFVHGCHSSAGTVPYPLPPLFDQNIDSVVLSLQPKMQNILSKGFNPKNIEGKGVIPAHFERGFCFQLNDLSLANRDKLIGAFGEDIF
jgi:hypothetical protein